jgi:hypothetical protein
MPKDKSPKALRVQLKEKPISFAVGGGSAKVFLAEQGGTRKLFRAARRRAGTTGNILSLSTPRARRKTNPEPKKCSDC